MLFKDQTLDLYPIFVKSPALPEMHTFRFLFDLPAYQVHRMPQKVAAGRWKQNEMSSLDSQTMASYVEHMSFLLLERNIHKGDRVVLLAARFDISWLCADMAIMATGAISVPVHYPQREADIREILHNMKPKLVLTLGDVNLTPFDVLHHVAIEEIIAISMKDDEGWRQKLADIRANLDTHQTATIVHTSGSSGEPRAVRLSHHNLVSNLMSVLSLVPFTPGTRVMSFLPLSHIFERIVCYVYLASGANVYFLDSYRYAVYAMKDVKPAYFSSVPLILERFAAVLEDRIEEMGWLTRWAYRSWEKTDRGFLSHIGSIIAHQWIIKRWRKKMGGQLRGIISGAAYLDPQVERLYERSGIRIRQGYGLTEASPVVSMNRFEPGGNKRGTVGRPVPGVEVKIAEDGEVLVKGPNVMQGYDGDPDRTNRVLRDEWLHTGDVGEMDRDGFLIIRDRKSSVYKHASGKFVAPARIESVMMHHHLIRFAMVIGFRRPYSVALMVPDFEALEKVAMDKKIHWTAPEYMVHNPAIIDIYRSIVHDLPLQAHERVEKFLLIADTWSPENGLLTPTLKVRRKEIETNYQKSIEELYED